MRTSEARGKRLLVFVGHYPSPYKPYYDTQLVEFVRAGYDVRIVAAPPLDPVVHEKVIEHGLLGRTRYYPVDGASATLPMAARLLTRPIAATRFMARRRGASLRRRAGDTLRMLALPRSQPDAVLVHELGVALTFEWLPDWHLRIPHGLYYHGGEVASVDAYRDEAVAQAFRRFDVVFTNTVFSRQQAIARGCPPEKVVVLPVGFDLDEYRPAAARIYRPGGTLRLLCVGRLSEEKGLAYALEALRSVVQTGRNNIRLSFAGDGYFLPVLQDFVRQNGLESHVRFLGARTAKEVRAELEDTDALVLSSHAHGNWTETQACAVQEAMLMKAVVITTATGGVPESIPDAMRKLSVAERDPGGLARAIEVVYDMRESELKELGEAGRTFVETRYDIRTLNQRMLTELWARSNTN